MRSCFYRYLERRHKREVFKAFKNEVEKSSQPYKHELRNLRFKVSVSGLYLFTAEKRLFGTVMDREQIDYYFGRGPKPANNPRWADWNPVFYNVDENFSVTWDTQRFWVWYEQNWNDKDEQFTKD